ncbi:MAG: hypothetical protein KBA30_09275 [Clostridia bacterium]|nr:hypothetical protein [Clostridia bacterium]
MVQSVLTCPECGPLGREDVSVRCERLRRQNLQILPVFPTCRSCGSEVAVRHACTGGSLIVLNGTCGSGKSSVAEELAARHGYLAMDGDGVLQSARNRPGNETVSLDSPVVLEEIGREIDLLSLYGDRFVLSHVILPEDADRYRTLFASRNLRCVWILLRPDIETALARCRTRTCHRHPTPEHWTRLFHDRLAPDAGWHVLDNGSATLQDTTDEILEIARRIP